MRHLFYKTCFCVLALQGTVIPQDRALSSKESFFLKRITEFWKDRDFALVKTQIHQFLSENPETQVADHLYAILGDLAFQEKNYPDATEAYQKIRGQALKEKTLYSHTLALYELKNYEGIIQLATPFFEKGNTATDASQETVQFILAESLFNQASQSSEVTTQEMLLQKAKPLYQSLASSTYKDSALLPLAETHRILREFPQACSLYQILAEKQADKAEDYLFQTATLQLAFDKNAAIETYGKLIQLKGLKAPDAAYNQCVLLFQQERFADLVSAAETISQSLAESKKSVFHFCVGRAHYTLGQFKEAAPHLEQYVNLEPEAVPQKKSAYLSLISCAQETRDAALFDHTLQALLSQFPQDAETAKALLFHAQKAIQTDNLEQAIADLERVLTTFPEFEQRETVLYDLALLLSQSKKWAESRKAFLSFLSSYPETPRAEHIWNYILNCSIQDLKAATPETVLEKKTQLAEDLKICLSKGSIIAPEEHATYQFLLSKTLFEISKYGDAIPEFETFLAAYPEHPSAAEGTLLLALSYREQDQNSEKFIEYGEKALALNPHFADRGLLHLQLYNACLAAGKLDVAAEHLFDCHVVEGHPIQVENQLWLANHYFGQVKEQQNVAMAKERAILLFKEILFIQDDLMKVSIMPETAFLEVEALKLSELLPLEQKALLLASLTETQSQYVHAPWKYQRQALFELGKTYTSLGDFDHALPVYDALIQTSSHTPSYFSAAAMLERNRILFSRCSPEERNENNPQIGNILSSLKDLQIQKKLLSEPIHLEAALDYAEIRSSLADPEKQRETELFFLKRIQEDFMNSEDSISQEYHEARQNLPEKDAIFKTYMKYIDARLLELEALSDEEDYYAEKAATSNQMLHALLNDPATTVDLQARIKNLWKPQ